MRKAFLLILLSGLSFALHAQKVVRFEFNLYTDSLKRGFYNYINLDGQLSDGSWRPLDSVQVELKSPAGVFRGNELFLDSSYRADSVIVEAALRSNPSDRRRTVIYIRKRGFPALPSEQEVLNIPADKRRKPGE